MRKGVKHIYCDFNETNNQYELKQEVYDYFEDNTDIININTSGDEIPISDLIQGNVYVIEYSYQYSLLYPSTINTINCGTFLGIAANGNYRFSYLFNPIDIPIGYAQDGSDSDSDNWGEANPLSYYYFVFYYAFFKDKSERISKKYVNPKTWQNVKIYVELEPDNIDSVKRPTNEIVQAYSNLFKNTHNNPASLNALNNFVHPFDMVMSGFYAAGIQPPIDDVYELAQHLPKSGGKTKKKTHQKNKKRKTRTSRS